MLGYLEGTVVAIRTDHCVINAGGVGYRVSARKDILSRLPFGHMASFWLYTAVRETAIDLYGFESEYELSLFELLLTVSGIGPKSALNILDVAGADTLRTAISQENASYLTTVSGIGKKTAEKIIVELKGKILPGESPVLTSDAEALEALKTLGYSTQEAREALRAVPTTVQGTNDRLREALKYMNTHV